MYSKLLTVAISAAKKAGSILKEGYGKDFKISSKDGKMDLVTEYDLASEKSIIEEIKTHFPSHNILAEESGFNETFGSDYQWVIDPLDGTVNFAHKIPIFSVSIAVIKNNELLCGVVFNPINDEMFYASKGGGAFLNDERISVSKKVDLKKSLLVTGFPYNMDENPNNAAELFVKIIQMGIPVRRLGSAAIDLAYVADGRFDGFWEIGLKPWDVAAGVLIVREAGGKVTNYSGNEFDIADKTLLTTNGILHEQLCVVFEECGFNNED